jgi:hypothetical protein
VVRTESAGGCSLSLLVHPSPSHYVDVLRVCYVRLKNSSSIFVEAAGPLAGQLSLSSLQLMRTVSKVLLAGQTVGRC